MAGIVGIHLDADRSCQGGLVGKKALQLRKGLSAGIAIGPALLAAGPRAALPLAAVADAGQVFQADHTAGMGSQDVRTDGMVGIQLQPSLSLADGDATPGGGASALSLKTLLQTSVVVRSVT